jgi:hypothetical protein
VLVIGHIKLNGNIGDIPMGMKAVFEGGEKLLGKGKGVAISRTGQKLGKRAADLQKDIRKLEDKDKLSRAEKAELSEMKSELRSIRKEMSAEPKRASRKGQQAAADKKAKPVTLPSMPFNKGGYANCGASVSGTQNSGKK